ncbi:MAG: anti-sigma factor family protein, partial [Planctomycetota bacterium]
MHCIEAKRDMFAFLDGAVSVERNLEILQHLNLCAACGKRFEAERRFEDRLRDTLQDEPVPATLAPRLDDALDRASAEMRRRETATAARVLPMPRFLRRLTVAAAAMFALVLVGGYATCQGPFQCSMVQAAVEVVDHVDHGDAEVVLTTDPAVASRELAQRGRRDVAIPDLSAAGLSLVGAASVVPAEHIKGTGTMTEYRSTTARVALVTVPMEKAPRSWNRTEDDTGTWYEAEHRG